MKKLILLTLAIALLANTGWSQKNNNTPKKAPKKAVLKNNTDSVSYALGILFAKSLVDQGFEDINTEVLLKSFDAIINKKVADSALLFDKETASPIVNNYFMQKKEMVAQKYIKEGQDFLEKNKKIAGVTSTPSGLQYKVITEGTGKKPTATDQVTVHYTGKLIDGRVFDSSVDRGQPATFALNGVIPGWTEGLQLMSEGSKYIFYIPSNLAYGEQGPPGSGIGPYATLIFEVELIKVGE